jgi:hypothetical protein
MYLNISLSRSFSLSINFPRTHTITSALARTHLRWAPSEILAEQPPTAGSAPIKQGGTMLDSECTSREARRVDQEYLLSAEKFP